MSAAAAPKDTHAAEIRALWKERPRSRTLRIAVGIALLAMLVVWFVPGIGTGDASRAMRGDNLARFAREVTPLPLRERDVVSFEGPPGARRKVVEHVDPAWDWSVFGAWAHGLWTERGAEAVKKTVAMSILAIVLAALWGAFLALWAARNFSRPSPFLPGVRHAGALERGVWRTVGVGTRVLLVIARAIPEYIWAFFLVALIGVRPGVGVSPWAPILALAIHNAGILGRLGAEAVENTAPASLAALRRLGARRGQISAVGPRCCRATCCTSSTAGRPASARRRCSGRWASSRSAIGSTKHGAQRATRTRCSSTSCSDRSS